MITQLQLLNQILETKDYSTIIENNITSDYFPNYEKEFIFINKHYITYGNVPDKATFLNAFPDFEIIQVTESKDYLVSEIYREHNEKFLASTFNKIKGLLMAGKTDDAMNLFSNAAQVASSKKHLDAINIMEDTSRYNDYVDRCTNLDKYYLSTGLRELDSSLGGGIDMENELGVVAARTGIGKSWRIIKMVTAAVKKGLKVGLFSGEMSVNKVGYRFDSLMSGVSNSSLVHGNISVTNEYKSYLDNLENDYTGKLFIMTRDMVDGNCGVTALRGFVEKYNLDILFIDQLSLLDDDKNARQPNERMANISKDLKVLQVTKKIPIISASQQNRTAVDDDGLAGTENIAVSDRVAQDASFVIFLGMKDNYLILNIAKARDGASQRLLKYYVNYDNGTFAFINSANDSEGLNREKEASVSPVTGEMVF